MYKTVEELQAELSPDQPTVPLSQGDILDACPLVFWGDETRKVAEGHKPQSVQARVIILTQACDLANEKTVRATVAVVHDAAHLVKTGRVKDKFIRDHVRKGQVYGWYFLTAHPSCPGFPESLVDLTGSSHGAPFFTGSTSRPGQAGLPADPPYREHLAQHFSVTYSPSVLPNPTGPRTNVCVAHPWLSV